MGAPWENYQDVEESGPWSQYAAPEEKAAPESFGSKIKEDLQKRTDMISDLHRQYQRGEQGAISTTLQMLGNAGAGAINDVVGQTISSVVPDWLKTAMQKGGQAVADTGAVKSAMDMLGPQIQEAVSGWEFLKKEHPELAGNIAAVTNIATAYPMVGGAGKAGKAIAQTSKSTIGKLGAVLEDAATKQATKQKEAYVKDLVMAPPTEKSIPRMTEPGIFGGKEVAPDMAEQKIIDVVKDIPGVKEGSFVGNYKAVNEALGKEAESLVGELRKNPVPIAKQEILSTLDSAADRALNSPLVASDATIKNTTQVLLDNAKRIIAANPNTSEGLLQARKRFDRYVESSRPKIFSQNYENAASSSTREIRQSLNDLIAEKNPNAMVKESLSKQTAMYNALDTIGPKALNEPASKRAGMFESVNKLLPEGKRMSPSVAKAIGIGTLGAAAAVSPAAVAAGGAALGTYYGGKFVLSPTAKKGLALMLKKTDQAIQYAAKDLEIKSKTGKLPTKPRDLSAEGEMVLSGRSVANAPEDMTKEVGRMYPAERTVKVSEPTTSRLNNVGRPSPGEQIPVAEGSPSGLRLVPDENLDVDPRRELEKLQEIQAYLEDVLKAEDVEKMGLNIKIEKLLQKYPRKK